MKKIPFILLLVSAVISLTAPGSFAQQSRTSQELSGMERTGQLIREDKALEKKLTKKKEKPEIEEKLPPKLRRRYPRKQYSLKAL